MAASLALGLLSAATLGLSCRTALVRASCAPPFRTLSLSAAAMTAVEPPTSAAAERLCLIDGHGLAYRMHFALQSSGMTTAAGQPTHALHGFCLKLLDLHERFPGSRMIVAFDRPEQTLREAMYPQYKAERPKMPMPLRPQLAAMIEACVLLGATPLSSAGYEADDVIAACVHHAEGTRHFDSIVVVSADKDLLQLVSPDGEGGKGDEGGVGGVGSVDGAPRVGVWDDKNKAMLDAAAVVAKHGVAPSQMADYLALMGDKSDNVPGVPGVGAKSAAALLGQYGSLNAVLEAAKTTMKPSKRRAALVDNEDLVRQSRELVGLRTDVPIDLSVVLGQPISVDGAELQDFLRRWELARVAKKVDQLRRRAPGV